METIKIKTLNNKYPDATSKALKEIAYLTKKGYETICYSETFRDCIFCTINDKEYISASQGYNPDKDIKNAIAYFYEDEESGDSIISRELLKTISNDIKDGIIIFTNAGVDIHTSEKSKYKNITVKKVSFNDFNTINS